MNLKVPAISGALREALHLWLGGRYSPFQKILKLGRRMKLGQFPSACCQAFPSTPSVALRAFPLRMTWDIGSRDFSLRAGSLLLRVARGLCCFALVAGLSQQSSWAQQAQLPSLQINFGSDGSYSVPLQILILMTLLTFVPAMVMSMTEFTRIIIVAHFLRQALGTQAAPSNQILIGLSLFLTLFIMGPVLDQIYDDAILPYQEEQLSQSDALAKASIPLRNFMLSHVREDDLALLIKICKAAEAKRRRRLGPAGDHPRLHALRAEDIVHNWLRSVPTFSGHRHGHRLGIAFDGNDPASSDHHFYSVQDPALRAG